VDAAQSIQAQTISIYIGARKRLGNIPVLNKVDLANPEESDDIVDLLV
jgi:translation elongation factor EF-4